jgi:RimJ/RimL family protein N-acetyltransferase
MTLAPRLQGEKVRLTAIMGGDVQQMLPWYQDSALVRQFSTRPASPMSQVWLRERLDHQRQASDDFPFAIRLLDEDTLIGRIDLFGVEWTQGTGWLGIIIAADRHQGRGYGTDALRLLLDFAFRELNLHRVQLTVFEYNRAAIALYEKLGFSREGVIRESLHRDGQRHDSLLYGILRHEWEA